MAGIRYLSQINMEVAPQTENHLVRVKDMIEYVASMTKLPVRVVLTVPFDGTYNTTAMDLTQVIPTELVIDGVTVNVDDRILLVAQTDATQNGIYVVDTLGVDSDAAAVLVRAEDFNSSQELINGIIIPVVEGDENAGSRWKLSLDTIPAILDMADIIFTKQKAIVATRVVEMTLLLEGDDDDMLYEIEHNMDSLNVVGTLRDNNTGETVYATFRRVDADNVEVELGVPLGDGNDLTLILTAQVD